MYYDLDASSRPRSASAALTVYTRCRSFCQALGETSVPGQSNESHRQHTANFTNPHYLDCPTIACLPYYLVLRQDRVLLSIIVFACCGI